MEHPILKHMNTGMSRYSVEKGPHAKHGDAPHRNSSPLDAHASKGRSGHPTHMQAGNDNSGNPNAASADEYWRVHQQTSHHKSPANNITYGDKSGPTGYIGEQRADDMKYNPVDDRAGMSRKSSPAKQNYNQVNVQDLQDMGEVKKDSKKRSYVVNERLTNSKADTLYVPNNFKSGTTKKKIKVGSLIDETDYENLSKKANNPVSRNKYDSPASIRKANSTRKDDEY